MSFPRTSAELVKNTSTVSPTTLPTVKNALDNLQGRAPTSLPVPISEGGTGQTTQTAAFNALSPQTTRGDLITRDATNDIRLPLGAAGTLLRSDGTDAVYSTFSAYLDAIFTGEANGDLIQRTAGTWTNVTVPTMLATLLTARGQIIRRGASAPEALAAQTADTFVGGDGTDVTTRTAAQVLTSLGIEVGTWTPTVTLATPGTFSATYSVQQGNYIKIVNYYIVISRINFTPTIGTGSGNVHLAGLPATVLSTRNGRGFTTALSNTGWVWPAGTSMVGLELVANQTYTRLYGSASGVSSLFTSANLTGAAAHDIGWAGIYIT